MTIDEKKIKLAERLGWKPMFKNPGLRWWTQPRQCYLSNTLPDWPNDLNACKELIEFVVAVGFDFSLKSLAKGIWIVSLVRGTDIFVDEGLNPAELIVNVAGRAIGLRKEGDTTTEEPARKT